MRRTFFIALFLGAGILTALPAYAADPCTKSKGPIMTFAAEIPIPNFVGGPITELTIGNYVRAIFIMFIGAVSIVAVVMVMFGGIKWVAAAGNMGQIQDARAVIDNAIIGVIIALVSVLLLNIINPDLAKFKGITLQKVDPCVSEFFSDILTATTDIPMTVCKAPSVKGEAVKACVLSGGQCTPTDPKLNDWINLAASKYPSDPFLIKAIMMHEHGIHTLGPPPKSEPTKGPESEGATRLGSAYGLGQISAETMLTQLKAVNNGVLPDKCPKASGTRNIQREAAGPLIRSCQQWLDDHMQIQVDMMAHLLHSFLTDPTNCFKSNPKLYAAAYNLGQQGALDQFCSNGGTNLALTDATLKNNAAAAAGYVRAVARNYALVCAASSL